MVSGLGNVAVYAIEKLQQFGATIVACSDSAGYVVDRDGIDLGTLKDVKETRCERIRVYADERDGAT